MAIEQIRDGDHEPPLLHKDDLGCLLQAVLGGLVACGVFVIRERTMTALLVGPLIFAALLGCVVAGNWFERAAWRKKKGQAEAASKADNTHQ